MGHAGDIDAYCLLFGVLALYFLADVYVESLPDLRWVHVLTVEGNVVLPQLFLYRLNVARLEGLCFLLSDGLL